MTQTDDATHAEDPAAAPVKRGLLVRFAPVAVILAGIALFFGLGLNRYLSLAALQENYEALRAFVEDNFLVALLAYAGAYIALTAFSLPGAGIMSLLGGFLFGPVVGTILVVAAATVGASIIFTVAKTAFGDALRAQAGGFARRMEAGFNENAFSYLLLLRLVPLFPFFVVNIAPALVGVPLRTFFLATLIGIIPGTFAYVSAGNGLGRVLELGGEVKLSGLLTQPEILTPIIALSVLALIPVVYKAVTRKRPAAGDGA